MHTRSDEWSVGPLWVRPLGDGRWELGVADGPVDQRGDIIGSIVRDGDVFEVTMLTGRESGASFGSLLSAIDFITHTLPAWSDAFDAAPPAASNPRAGAGGRIERQRRDGVKKTHLVPVPAVPAELSRAKRPIPEHRTSGDYVVQPGPVMVGADSEGKWAVLHESAGGGSLLIGLVYQIGSRFEVTVMSDPARMISVDSLAAAVDHLAVDGVSAQRLRGALRR